MKLWWTYSLMVCLVFLIVFIVFLALPVHRDFELKTIDIRYRLVADLERHSTKIDDPLIITVDQRSVDKLGKFAEWPATWHATMIDFLTRAGATGIIFDIVFDESRNAGEYSQFVEATQRSGRVVHGIILSNAQENSFPRDIQTGIPINLEQFFSEGRSISDGSDVPWITLDQIDNTAVDLLNASWAVGSVNCVIDSDGVIRRVPLFSLVDDHAVPTLALAYLLKQWQAGPRDVHYSATDNTLSIHAASQYRRIPLSDDGMMWISFAGTYGTFRYLSYYDVLRERIPADFFKDKTVIIGTSLPALYDLRSVPLQAHFPGTEVHANILRTLQQAKFLRQCPFTLTLLILLCCAILPVLLSSKLGPFPLLLSIFILAGVLLAASFVLFVQYQLILEIIRPLTVLTTAYITAILFRFRGEEREKRRIKKYFQQYVSAEIVDEVLKRPGALELGGERRTISILFSDIRNFSRLSEELSPENLVAFLNSYLTTMTRVLLRNEGTLDKFIGDSLVGLFGAPVWRQNHAEQAVRTALMMKQALEKFKAGQTHPSLRQLAIGIGVNTGEVIIGNFGSEMIFDYTAIGDEMNLASRIEGLNKHYGTTILVSEATRLAAGDCFIMREIDRVIVKGRQTAVSIHEALGFADGEDAEMLCLQRDLFTEGLIHYRNRDFSRAMTCFEQVVARFPTDRATKLFIERCQAYQHQPPAPSWDGAWIMETK